ncbi:hypothetical protein [Luteimonas sp. 100069]|uniref:hypothetical protein n=1 Tax=Luteimonas sp. 100069 TaxID=2006109 RepID=UPI000F4F1029|nr:hypothetical protein [Luteimonas sp. 100069]RPD88517.1 hypothetical protein EGK76_05055 [Luteimonas sp. 100069]
MDRDVRLQCQTVRVEDGRITALGDVDSVEVPADATLIDGAGRVRVPGLVEMHGHVSGDDDPAYVEDALALYLANGFSLVRNMPGDPSHRRCRRASRPASSTARPSYLPAFGCALAMQQPSPTRCARITRPAST